MKKLVLVLLALLAFGSASYADVVPLAGVSAFHMIDTQTMELFRGVTPIAIIHLMGTPVTIADHIDFDSGISVLTDYGFIWINGTRWEFGEIEAL